MINKIKSYWQGGFERTRGAILEQRWAESDLSWKWTVLFFFFFFGGQLRRNQPRLHLQKAMFLLSLHVWDADSRAAGERTDSSRWAPGSDQCSQELLWVRHLPEAAWRGAGDGRISGTPLLLSPPYPRQPGIAAEFTHTHTRADEGETATTGNLHTAALAFNFTFLMGERLQ